MSTSAPSHTGTRTCAECGQPIPGDAQTLGLCPRCLILGAMSEGGRQSVSSDAKGIDDGWIDVTDDILGPTAPATAPPNPPAPADLAAGFPELEIGDLLGRGGMGLVYRARQIGLDRTVALKLFPLDHGADRAGAPTFADRFRLEARVLARLSHPHVVSAFHSGQTDRYCYLVMEYVAGGSLRDALLRGGPLPQAAAVRVAMQVCDAIEYAHGQGIVHRDIKPENILLDAPPSGERIGRVKVADFGLAKLVDHSSPWLALTTEGEQLGTPLYAAPEQGRRSAQYTAAAPAGSAGAGGAASAPVDQRADLYSLGVVLYEMLTGDLPVGNFPTPSQRAAGVDSRLDVIVLRCLDPDPALRYQTAAELRAELARLAAPNAPPPAVAVPMPPPAVIGPLSYQPPLAARLQAAPQRATLALALAAVAILVVAVAVPFLVYRARRAAALQQAAVATSSPTQQQQTPPGRPPAIVRVPVPVPAPGTGFTGATPGSDLPAYDPLRYPFGTHHGSGIGGGSRINSPRTLQDLIAQHGAGRVVTLRVDGMPGDVRSFVQDRVAKLSGAGTMLSSGSAANVTIHLAPVPDLQGLADRIDFGRVTKVDAAERVIEVQADPAKLPAPLQPAVIDPKDPAFFDRNIEDLGVWEPTRRREALGRLKLADPSQLPAERAADVRPKIARALEARLKDAKAEDGRARADVIAALGTWGTAESVPLLIELLSSPEEGNQRQVMESLGKLGDARAAVPVAKLLPTSRADAAACLKKLGPAAEPAVLPYLTHEDRMTRTEAARILGDIGTPASLPALRAAAEGRDGLVPMNAKAAIKAIEQRQK